MQPRKKVLKVSRTVRKQVDPGTFWPGLFVVERPFRRMLEDSMSVWSPAAAAALSGAEGELISVSIDVDPRFLESLLEALARVSFPINPQIYHEAAMVYLYADGHRETEAVTLVEFPAYAGQLDEVRAGLSAFGFDPARVQVTAMLDEIHAEPVAEPAPKGAAYAKRFRRKSRGVARSAGYQP